MAADKSPPPPDASPEEGSADGSRSSRPPSERLPFERIVPELLRRSLDVGRGAAIPREIAASVVTQLSEAREGIVNVVGLEVGRFLRQADIAGEIRNVLSGLEVEASVKLKFKRSKDQDADPPAGDPAQPAAKKGRSRRERED